MDIPIWVFEFQIIGFFMLTSGVLACIGMFFFIGGIERLFNYWLWRKVDRRRFLRAFKIAVKEKEADK